MPRTPHTRKSYPADADVGIDQEGYVMADGDDNPTVGNRDTVKKATATDAFGGVVYNSTSGIGRIDNMEIKQGDELSLTIDGYANVLVDTDAESQTELTKFEDKLYVDDTNEPGVTSTGGAGAPVGPVINSKDLSEESGLVLAQVYIGGNLGAEPEV